MLLWVEGWVDKKQAGKKKRHNFISYASRDVAWIAQVLVIPDEGNVLSSNYITAALNCFTRLLYKPFHIVAVLKVRALPMVTAGVKHLIYAGLVQPG